MTLTEYVVQENPRPMPIVLLVEGEYVEIHRIEHLGLTWVRIHTYPDYVYVRKDGSRILWTIDEDGNAKSISCFKVKDII